MRLYFSVMLAVEIKEGGRLSWDSGAREIVNESGSQSATNQDIIERLRDVLADVTKHDDTIMWRIVDIIEGSGVELDGSNSTVLMES